MKKILVIAIAMMVSLVGIEANAQKKDKADKPKKEKTEKKEKAEKPEKKDKPEKKEKAEKKEKVEKKEKTEKKEKAEKPEKKADDKTAGTKGKAKGKETAEVKGDNGKAKGKDNKGQERKAADRDNTVKSAPASRPAQANTGTQRQVAGEDKVYGKDDKGRTLYQGPRGGIYYINSNGNKTYTKKDN